MKTINVVFTDDEFKKILEAKGNDTWHDFILKMAEEKLRQKNKQEVCI